jgi:site-specific DNA-adenine methylase
MEGLNIRYVGSKNKISKEIVPIVQKYINENNIHIYFEPFVGGANMIDKIKCDIRIGNDINQYLIALLKHTQKCAYDIPNRIMESEYINVKNNKDKFPDWYVGLVGFCSSFGAKFFGGYARDSRSDNSGKWSVGAIQNLKKQEPNIKSVKFTSTDYLTLDETKMKNWVIYCDPPYQGTTKYDNRKFEYDVFWQWVRDVSKNNCVFVSEYSAPKDFECIWQKKCKTLLDSNKNMDDKENIRIERLFVYKDIKSLL